MRVMQSALEGSHGVKADEKLTSRSRIHLAPKADYTFRSTAALPSGVCTDPEPCSAPVGCISDWGVLLQGMQDLRAANAELHAEVAALRRTAAEAAQMAALTESKVPPLATLMGPALHGAFPETESELCCR